MSTHSDAQDLHEWLVLVVTTETDLIQCPIPGYLADQHCLRERLLTWAVLEVRSRSLYEKVSLASHSFIGFRNPPSSGGNNWQGRGRPTWNQTEDAEGPR
jgi:hypothetical protein